MKPSQDFKCNCQNNQKKAIHSYIWSRKCSRVDQLNLSCTGEYGNPGGHRWQEPQLVRNYVNLKKGESREQGV